MIGRENERGSAARVLESGGLVTLVGPPGVGKSAIARSVVRGVSVDYVGLDGARDAAELTARVSSALGERPAAGGLDALAFRLGRRRRVVVFDDADDVRAPLAALVAKWLPGVPGSAALVTSARRLGLGNEKLVRVAPLGTPAAEDDDDGVRLFLAELERRSLGRRTLAPLDGVARIVGRVEGLPLAILRAAALASVVGVAEVERLLDGEGLEDVPSDEVQIRSRHHTLRLAFDALWSSLDTPELRLHAAELGLLRGTFSLEAAAAVTGLAPAAAIELLRQLEDRSLVLSDGGEPPGFRYLAPVRARAEAWLGQRRARSAAASRMVELFANRVDASHTGAVRLTEPAWAREHESAKGALVEALALRRHDQAALIAIGMAPLYLSRGPLDEYVRLLDELGRHAAKLPRVRAGALALLSGLALLFSGQREQSALPFSTAARLAGSADRATAQSYLGLVHGLGGDFRRARRCFAKAEQLAGSKLEASVEARILKNAANVLAEEGSADALDVIARARSCFQRAGDVRGEGFMVLMHASVLLDQAELERAAVTARQAMRLLTQAGDARSLAWAECILATIDRDAGRPELAREGYQRSTEALRAVRDDQTLGIVLELWATLELEQHAPHAALALCNEASELLARALDHEHLAMTRALLGVAHAMDGRREAARVELEQARALLPRRGRPARRSALALLALATATTEVREAALARPRATADGEEARSATRILRALGHHSVPAPREAVLHVALDHAWMVAPDGRHIELASRPVARRLVEILVRTREKSPGTPVTAARLLKHAWPNQQIRRDALQNRLYVALTRLRSMGLERVVEKNAEGYFIDRNVSIVRAAEPPALSPSP